MGSRNEGFVGCGLWVLESRFRWTYNSNMNKADKSKLSFDNSVQNIQQPK